MGWRVDLLDYLQTISEEMGFDFFGTWNLQSEEESNDIFHTENALLFNLDFNNDYISYNSSQDNFSLEKEIDFSLFVCVKNKDFNIEKHREIFNFCDSLEIRMMQQNSPFNTLTFKGESPVLPHSELIIREQKYSIFIFDTHDKINEPIPSEVGDITRIQRDFCIKTT